MYHPTYSCIYGQLKEISGIAWILSSELSNICNLQKYFYFEVSCRKVSISRLTFLVRSVSL